MRRKRVNLLNQHFWEIQMRYNEGLGTDNYNTMRLGMHVACYRICEKLIKGAEIAQT